MSKDTGREAKRLGKADVEVLPDGEGGIFLTLCWYRLLDGLGSAGVHLPPKKATSLIDAIREAQRQEEAE